MSARRPLAAKLEQWSIDRLKPNPKNPRLHSPQQVARIIGSIVEFGFTNPILIDAKGGVIAGHGRLAAARRLNWKTVPVVVLGHLSELQRRAYMLADNRIAEDSEWDPAMLAQQLRELEAEAFDITAAGFSQDELEALEEAVRKSAAEASAPARRGAAAGRILHMLEFDTQEQKDQVVEFLSWLQAKSPRASRGAALAAHATAAMPRSR